MSATVRLQVPSLFRALTTATLLGVSVLSLSACAPATTSGVYHGVIMRGQIVSLDGKSGVICIGKHDNAETGQMLDVIRHKQARAVGRSSLGTFERIIVGEVRITNVVDDHYSEIEVVSGDVRATDTIELKPK